MQTDSFPFHASERDTDDGQLGRWASIATAAAMIAYGITRRSKSGFFLAAAAAPLVYRGIAGDWPDLGFGRRDGDTRKALSGTNGIHVREAIRLETPVDEVFAFWRRFENLPLFMTHLERVIDLGGRRSHWVARGPAGSRVEWDAEIINEQQNKLIAWRSLPGSDVVMAGSVHFDPVRAGTESQVTIHLQYSPPAGRAGAAVATLLGSDPSQSIREDLRHFKQLVEAGEVPRATTTETPTGARP
jgi:uncharacterized membrane protein